MDFRKEYAIEGRWKKDTKFHVVTSTVADNSERGWHKIKSLEEARSEVKRIQAEQQWQQKHKKCKPMTCGCIGISTEYYSDYDLVELRIIERQVSNWYIVE